ncbi:unnamed protein product [Mycena citricolor]|uniref:Uncharacterized protein n=1 Tax=Mycena citricolor TaxID=2018698 RepID=A0AAD2HXW4_9AGAR|nr:unnamed protein product [Mycena citricolor]
MEFAHPRPDVQSKDGPSSATVLGLCSSSSRSMFFSQWVLTVTVFVRTRLTRGGAGVPSIFTCFRAGSNCKRALRCGGLGEMDSVAHRMSPPARGMRSACSSSVGAPEKTEAIVGTTRSPAVVAREKAEGGDCWGMTSCASASFLRFSSLRGALGRGWDINGALKVDDVNFLHRGFA